MAIPCCGGKTLEAALGARIVVGTGQTGQPVQRRHLFIPGAICGGRYTEKVISQLQLFET